MSLFTFFQPAVLRTQELLLKRDLRKGLSTLPETVINDKARNTTTYFTTDLEGDYDWFLENLKYSTVLELVTSENGQKRLSFKEIGSSYSSEVVPHFVFGGDLFDHSGGDLRLAKLFVDFHKAFPAQVHLLAGNRDLNKLRLRRELDASRWNLHADHPSHIVPYWHPVRKRMTIADYLGMNNLKDTPINRLKWMLEKTMGAPAAFEMRKKELAILSGKEMRDITDNDVFESYFSSILPGGILYEYLRYTKIAVIIKDSLFLHGALTENNIGVVPGFKQRELCIYRWVEKLNKWAQREVSAWESSWDSDERARILDYVVAGGMNGQTVVYNSWLKKDFAPRNLMESQRINCAIEAAGISRVLTGHQPHGDSPTIFRGKSFYALSADTTYSSYVPGGNHRSHGYARLNVEVQNLELNSLCNVSGRLSSGEPFDFVVEEWDRLGEQVDGKEFIKIPLKETDEYLCWKPGSPFPNSLIYSRIPFQRESL